MHKSLHTLTKQISKVCKDNSKDGKEGKEGKDVSMSTIWNQT
jgi:hypothetical protein